MIDNVKRTILYKMVGIVIFIVLYIWYSIRLRNRCRVGVGYLKIIPRDLMYDIKVTLFMKKNDFLNKVTILWYFYYDIFCFVFIFSDYLIYFDLFRFIFIYIFDI
jgi:hypothetical protein